MLNFANLMKCIRERLHKKATFLLNYFVVKMEKVSNIGEMLQ